MKICSWTVFGAKSRPGRLADGFPKLPGYHFWRQGGLKRCPMGPFLGPPWIQNGSKIMLSSIGRHLDPPKMVSGRGFGKNMKIQWKNDAKIEGFWWLRTTFGVILFAYNTLSPFSKKNQKIDAKRDAKRLVFWSKNGPWAAKGRLILQFW